MGIKHTINEHFFDSWSPAMAYILGFIYADGSMDRCPNIRASYVNMFSTDREILVAIKNAMRSRHSITEKPHTGFPRLHSQKKLFQLRIGNNYLCNALETHGIHPRKSLTIRLPHIPSSMLGHFVRGYFDGDGCVYIERIPKKRTARLRVIFTSGSKLFLIELESAIRKELSLKPRVVYDSHRSYQLSYSTADSRKLFDFMYKKPYDELYLRRKKQLFETYLSA